MNQKKTNSVKDKEQKPSVALKPPNNNEKFGNTL